MRKKIPVTSATTVEGRLERRDALKGLAALAVSGPALAALSCGSEDSADGGGASGTSANGGAAGTSGAAGTGATAGTNGVSGSGGTTGAGGTAGTGGTGGSGATGGTEGSAGNAGVAGTGAQGGSGGTTSLPPPTFDDVPTCTLTTTDIEGPFFIDETEIPNDISLVRADIRDGHPGVEFRFYFRLLDARKNCAPIPNAEVYIWHCDADGYYSGFSGQDPAQPYTGAAQRTPETPERFCRGVQSSGMDGIVGFLTIYPGWYAGRPLHVHLLARFSGSTTRLITTQLYFQADVSRRIHQAEPAYAARAANIPASSLNPPRGNPAIPTLDYTPGLVIGKLNVIVNGL
jgi:protocatechuate 3,4-dioxygenase beta subunit